MRRAEPEIIDFREPDHPDVVGAMAELTTAQAGWINLYPDVRDEDRPPPRSALLGIFSGSGPSVPESTWVAAQPKQKPPHPEIGIQHAAGPKAVRRLTEVGVPVPDRWVVLADHPKRGLVVAVHPDADHGEVLAWLMAAAAALSPVPFTGEWHAVVQRPGSGATPPRGS